MKIDKMQLSNGYFTVAIDNQNYVFRCAPNVIQDLGSGSYVRVDFENKVLGFHEEVTHSVTMNVTCITGGGNGWSFISE
jgi:hypothetical protein